MARPSKSVMVISKNLTKEEIATRLKTEKKLKGEANKITSPKHLSTAQKKIFKNIVTELEASGILGNLDIYILSTCSIALDRMQEIEKMINENPMLMRDRDLRMTNDKYTRDFFRCCNELSLSPQSRAKIGNIALQNKQHQGDPLLKVLNRAR